MCIGGNAFFDHLFKGSELLLLIFIWPFVAILEVSISFRSRAFIVSFLCLYRPAGFWPLAQSWCRQLRSSFCLLKICKGKLWKVAEWVLKLFLLPSINKRLDSRDLNTISMPEIRLKTLTDMGLIINTFISCNKFCNVPECIQSKIKTRNWTKRSTSDCIFALSYFVQGAASMKEFYAKNSRWTEGLISASKAVGWGATVMV